MTRVQVLSVAKLTDIITGETAVQVNFGDTPRVDAAMRERFQGAAQQPPVGKEAIHAMVSIILPPNDVEPYQVGSWWILERTPTGEMTLKRA
jgi:hypothetical protein